MGRVLIPQAVAPEGVAFLEERGHEVVQGSGADVETIVREVSGCDAILARTASFPAAVLEAEPALRVIARHGVGYDNIDVARASELEIQVTFTPEANAGSVAEMTIALMLAITRNLVRADAALRAGDFAIRNRELGVDLIGKTLLVVGVGRIGRLVAQKAHDGLGMRVLGFDPAPAANLPGYVALAAGLDEALTRADVVSLHLPSTPETKGSFDATRLSHVKREAYLVNCARGDIVNEADLAGALREGQIAGAALDVFADEPPAPDHPFFTLPNVIVTPHIAALTRECVIRMAMDAAKGIDDVLAGRPPRWPVNRPGSG